MDGMVTSCPHVPGIMCTSVSSTFAIMIAFAPASCACLAFTQNSHPPRFANTTLSA